jgi:hypothetical protein
MVSDSDDLQVSQMTAGKAKSSSNSGSPLGRYFLTGMTILQGAIVPRLEKEICFLAVRRLVAGGFSAISTVRRIERTTLRRRKNAFFSPIL